MRGRSPRSACEATKATKQLPHDTVGMGACQLDAHPATADDDANLAIAE
jgi:hypothetical protein